ncbi:hypothetical protein HY312_04915 [Candidatus Saccharibacteria bacterium]|nr:hypothetical protein [Candidatus Saccharibacteria bacterium]
MNSSLSSLTTPVSHFFGKYHATIFFTAIILLLAGAILSLYLTTTQSLSAQATTDGEVVSSTFDDKTAEQIQALRESNESTTDLVYPGPRSNPFVE